MRIYLVSNTIPGEPQDSIYEQYMTRKLVSHFYKPKLQLYGQVDIFYDSGAYTAATKGVVIDIDEYKLSLQQNSQFITTCSNLDVIGDAQKSAANYNYLHKHVDNMIPVYHIGSNFKYLKRMVRLYPYIAIGGMITGGVNTAELDYIFNNYILGKDNKPKVKVHGFGVTDIKLLVRYPWYSVDSSTWILNAAFGRVLIPARTKYGFDYTNFVKLYVGNKDCLFEDSLLHKHLLLYLSTIGIPFGETEYIPKRDKGLFAYDPHVITPGISNDYRYRWAANIIYYNKLEHQINKTNFYGNS